MTMFSIPSQPKRHTYHTFHVASRFLIRHIWFPSQYLKRFILQMLNTPRTPGLAEARDLLFYIQSSIFVFFLFHFCNFHDLKSFQLEVLSLNCSNLMAQNRKRGINEYVRNHNQAELYFTCIFYCTYTVLRSVCTLPILPRTIYYLFILNQIFEIM